MADSTNVLKLNAGEHFRFTVVFGFVLFYLYVRPTKATICDAISYREVQKIES